MIYTISYFFDGFGEVKIKAKNEEEARKKFLEGDFADEEEWGEQYNISNIEKEIKIK